MLKCSGQDGPMAAAMASHVRSDSLLTLGLLFHFALKIGSGSVFLLPRTHLQGFGLPALAHAQDKF